MMAWRPRCFAMMAGIQAVIRQQMVRDASQCSFLRTTQTSRLVASGQSTGLPPAGGRYFADTWVLDLEQLEWAPVDAGAKAAAPPPSSTPTSPPPAPMPPMPPTAGHAMVAWGGNVLSIGGHTKVQSITSLAVPPRTRDGVASNVGIATAFDLDSSGAA